jgi:hypothetical protein
MNYCEISGSHGCGEYEDGCLLGHDGGNKRLWNVGKLLPDYRVQQPRRQLSSWQIIVAIHMKCRMAVDYKNLKKFCLKHYFVCRRVLTLLWHCGWHTYPEVPGSNLGPETGYPEWGTFLSPSREKPVEYLDQCHDSFIPYPIQFIIRYSFILSFDAI